jgi:hypothetical protein
MIYDIHLLHLGFQPVAVVGKLVQKWERDSYIRKEKNTQTAQKHKIHKTENKLTKQENKHKKKL